MSYRALYKKSSLSHLVLFIMNTQLGDNPRANAADEYREKNDMSYIEFDFNTALTGVDSENGKFDERAFEEIAKKIRGYIMSQPSGDGISGMRVSRYGMHVDYEANATTRDKITTAVEASISWAADTLEGAFPLRENKVPTAVTTTHVQKPTGRTAVTARLKTNLYRRPIDEEESASVRKDLAAALVDLDGVREFRIGMDGVSLDISDDVTDPETAKKHIQELLQKFANDSDSPYLPFAKSTTVDIEWSVEPYMR